MLLSCRLRTDKPSPLRVSYSCDNPQLYHLVNVRGSSLGLCPKHFPLQTPVIHSYNTPSFLLAQHSTSFLQTVIHGISPLLTQSIYPPTYTLSAILSFSFLSIWSHYRRILLSIISSTPFITPHISLICSFTTLSTFLIPNRLEFVYLQI